MSVLGSEAEAAAVLRECQAELAARCGTLLGEASGGEVLQIVDWRHYPAGEIYDPTSHVQFFFHRHPADQASEGGHFHVFLRGEGMPAGVTPLLLPDLAVANSSRQPHSAPLKRGIREEVCHLAAVAIDARGAPVRLFTTNRWVTGETWYRADDVILMLDRVRFARGPAYTLLERWIAAVVRLFRPEITVLLRRRDRMIAEWRCRWPRRNVFEDPRLEITSHCDIDLEARLAAIEARAMARREPRTPRRLELPSQAEGWGA